MEIGLPASGLNLVCKGLGSWARRKIVASVCAAHKPTYLSSWPSLRAARFSLRSLAFIHNYPKIKQYNQEF
jgi:hypothetical protein